jgi:hypothetical protein
MWQFRVPACRRISEARTTRAAPIPCPCQGGFIIRATAAGELASEELRLLIHAIHDQQENEFRDDATIMLLEWRPSRSKAPPNRR